MKAATGIALAFALALVQSLTFAQSNMRVHFIDVGQGDATLLEFPCGAILVDTGGESNGEFDSTDALIDYLDQFFQGRADLGNRLDSLIISHPHLDHTRGVKEVLQRYHPKNAVTDGLETGSGKFGQIAIHRAAEAGEATPTPDDDIGLVAIWERDIPTATGVTSNVIDPLDCDADGNPQIRALWGRVDTDRGWSKTNFENENNHSVVIRVDYGKNSILLGGDLEKIGINALTARYQASHLLDVDVYKVGHHGSLNGTTKTFVQEMSPEFAVISVGVPDRHVKMTAWDHGHPRKTVVDVLIQGVSGTRPLKKVKVAPAEETFVQVQMTKAIYATGWDGTVVLEGPKDGNWTVLRPTGIDSRVGGTGVSGLINVNSASVDDLLLLPMIGPSRAQAIVAHRPYSSVDELGNVPGIGAATLGAIRHLVTVQ